MWGLINKRSSSFSVLSSNKNFEVKQQILGEFDLNKFNIYCKFTRDVNFNELLSSSLIDTVYK